MKILHVQLDQLPEGYEGILLSACADGKQLLCENESLEVSGELPLNDSCKDLIKSLEVTISKLLPLTSHVPDLQDSQEGTGDCKGRENTLSRGYGPPTSRATVDKVVGLYNAHAAKNKWQQAKVIGLDLRKRLSAAVKQFPDMGQWELIMKGWEADDWFSGRRGDYNRTKILTMLHKRRYEEFYADALALQEQPKKLTTDDILDEFRVLLGGVQ